MSYVPNGTLFDGTTNNLALGAGLTGAADNKLLLFSGWIRMDGADAASTSMINVFGPSSTVQVIHDNNNAIQFIAPAATLDVQSSNNSLNVATGWTHAMGSFNMGDVGDRHLFVNDVSDLIVTTYVDAVIDWTTTDAFIGSNQVGAALTPAAFSEFYLTNEFLDLSVEANRRLFIDANGFPVDLGADGSTPTGTAPLVYMRNGGQWTPGLNAGTGGDFTVNGTFARSDGPINPIMIPRALSRRSGRYARLGA